MSRRNRPAVPDDSSRDLKRQEGIFLSTFALMVLFLVSLYLPLPVAVPIVLAAVLVAWTVAMYVKFHDFYKMRDRGQRTWCVTISMYASLILTLACAWYFTKDAPLTDEYALVFLFGFMFFTYMVYRTLSPTMVVGNRRVRYK